MLVPVAVVGGVAMSFVNVINVIVVARGLMPASLAVAVAVFVVDGVDIGVALVPVIVVDVVDMAVVEVVGVPVVMGRRVAAVRPVVVVVIGVRLVRGLASHGRCSFCLECLPHVDVVFSGVVISHGRRRCVCASPAWLAPRRCESAGLLLAMGDGVPRDVRDMLVSERVDGLLASPRACDEARRPQDPQVLGRQRLGYPEPVDELVDTARAVGQVENDRQSVWGSERTQQLTSSGESVRVAL